MIHRRAPLRSWRVRQSSQPLPKQAPGNQGGLRLKEALILALRAWFIRWTNEIVVTDRRVIYARGFIQRHTVEVHMDKIESVDVDQTLMGRILDYGDVTIRGTGTTLEPIRDVDRPVAFRNEVTAR